MITKGRGPQPKPAIPVTFGERRGLIELRRNVTGRHGAEGRLTAGAPLGHRDRNLGIGIPTIPTGPLSTKTRVLFVDGRIDTGGQLRRLEL
ncbi:MAG: hypothetical protein QM628_11825 [Propionicimonas sp.]